MRQAMLLIVATITFAVSAAAQGPAGAGSRYNRAANLPNWQLGVGYQYNRINLLGSPFNTNGANLSVTRFFGRWVGLDGTLGLGFGNTGTTSNPTNLTTKSVFVGGGPRVAFRGNTRIEPWVRGGVGMMHFRFEQTAGLLGRNTSVGMYAGGGIDLLLTEHVSVRLGADWLGTRFFDVNQRNFQATGGFVFNF